MKASGYSLAHPITVPSKVNPLVQRLYAIMHEQRVGYHDLAARSGIGRATLCRWRSETAPKLDDIEAALNALGYELCVRERVA